MSGTASMIDGHIDDCEDFNDFDDFEDDDGDDFE
jgi:hypothetical protein